MLALDVLYVSLTTLALMAIMQLLAFGVTRILTPPEPKIIYREIRVPEPAPKVTFTEPPVQEIKIPEYEPRKQDSDSLRLDPQLPAGIQETRPPGT